MCCKCDGLGKWGAVFIDFDEVQTLSEEEKNKELVERDTLYRSVIRDGSQWSVAG